MRIVTWNVNSVRARLERVLAVLERHQPDLVCLQETKVTDEVFPVEAVQQHGYRVERHGQKAYNGVALLSRAPLEAVQRGFPGNPAPGEARVISGTLGGLRVINLYVVNGQAMGTDKYALKLQWLDALIRWVEADHDPGAPLLIVGDFNIAPDDRDVHEPELWRNRVLVSDPERERLQRLLAWGLSDLLRCRTDEAGVFTWWDYRFGAFRRDLGLRLDLALGTAPLVARLASVDVDREERARDSGPGLPSDHAPVIVDLV